MRLNEVTKQTVIWAGEDDLEGYQLILNRLTESAAQLRITQPPEKGGVIKGIGGFAKNHPVLTGMVAGLAVNALSTYLKNKKYVTRFYAANNSERAFYTKMVDMLMKTGHYKINKRGYEGGAGYMWELQRIK